MVIADNKIKIELRAESTTEMLKV